MFMLLLLVFPAIPARTDGAPCACAFWCLLFKGSPQHCGRYGSRCERLHRLALQRAIQTTAGAVKRLTWVPEEGEEAMEGGELMILGKLALTFGILLGVPLLELYKLRRERQDP